MFRIPTNETFWAKVKTAYTDEEGRRINGEFEIQCKRMTIPQASDLFDSFRETDHPNANFLDGIVIGWRGVNGDDNQPLAFSAEALRAISDAGFAGAMVAAFYENLQGTRVKN